MARSSARLVLCPCSRCIVHSRLGGKISISTANKHRQRDVLRQAAARDRQRVLLSAAEGNDIGLQGGDGQMAAADVEGAGLAAGVGDAGGPTSGSDVGSPIPDRPVDDAGPALDPFDGNGGDLQKWIRLLHVMVVWLNCGRGLARSDAHLLLLFIAVVILADRQQPLHIDTIRRRLGIEVKFRRFVVCPNLECQDAVAVPVRFFSYSPVIPFLNHCWRRPGFEAAVNSWRRRPRQEGYQDVYDGEAWSERTNGGHTFTSHRHHLNLAVSLDWFEPFTRRGTGSYSMGVLALRIDNLPASVRNRKENIHVVAILPGPKQTSAQGLEAAMAPLIEPSRS
ncbi:unnamed protein product [Tilletia controversa]|nr:unnamed protein product [Tilletia controversa]